MPWAFHRGLLAYQCTMTSMWMLRAAPAACLLATFACHHDASPTAPEPGAPPPAAYRLVWPDEFDRDGAPDAAQWSHDVGGHGWGNKESQFYTTTVARTHGWKADISWSRRGAKPWQGRDYTSARLVTKGKGDWTYGRIEVRA